MNGIYTGSMGMIHNMVKMDVISNNIANVNTDGYKKDHETFRVFDEPNRKINSKQRTENIGPYQDKVYVDNITTNFELGSIKQTSGALDMVLYDKPDQGSVSFFIVQKGDNTYLTRNGNFKLDGDRRLSTLNGGLVLGSDGNPIVIPEGENPNVNQIGEIFNSDGTKKLGQVQIKEVKDEDLGLLDKKQGGFFEVKSYEKTVRDLGGIDNLIDQFDTNVTIQKVFGTKERLFNMRDTGEINILNDFTGELKNYMIEASNVNLSDEFVEMIQAQKNIQAGQKIVQSFDGILNKEANELAK